MKSILLFIPLILLSCSSAKLNHNDDRIAIIETMKAQEDGWNRGDLESFMDVYWRSDSLKFIGRNGVTYGWDNVLKNYKKAYSTKEKMGILDFDIIHLDRLGPEVYRMIGSYHLHYHNNEDQHGFFTLIWQKIGMKWKISSDHTSG